MDENLEKPTKNFTMLAPPPNITGNLHIGHALTLSIQDAIARWYRMSGHRVSWIPGTDHAGIGTQSVVERQLYKKKNLTRHDLGRENFINEVWKWRELHGNRIIEQMVKYLNFNYNLGSDDNYAKVDYETVPKQTFLKIPGHQESGILELVVATTRIETMLGDCAVAIHPDDTRYEFNICFLCAGNIQDWCISRQLWWGHPVPAYNLTYEGQKSDEGLWFAATSLFEAEQFAKKYFQQNNSPSQTNYTLKQVRDAQGRKMSKSLGNVIDPLNVIEGVTLEEMHQTILNISCSSFIESRNHLTLVDKYILSRLSDTVAKCQVGFEKFELFEVTKVVKDFIVEDLCGIYLEFIKPTLYENSEHIDTKKTTLKVLETCLDTSLRLLHPFMPFLTELWQSLVERCDNSINLGTPESIMVTKYPKVADFENQKDPTVEDDMKPLPFIIWSDDQDLLDEQGSIKKYFQDIKKFIKASEIRVIDDKLQKESLETLITDSAVTLISTNLKVYVPMSSILEIQKNTDVNNYKDKSKTSSNGPPGTFRTENLSRLTKKYEKIKNEIEILQGRITKVEYLKKVPEKVKEND
ncbi:2_t:CDS:10, partial [Racocetra fulgida]